MIDYNTRLLYLMKYVGPLNMRCRFRMKESVNPEALDAAVQKAMTRYPYLAKRIALRDGTFVLEENPLPVPVIRTRHPMPSFGSEECNHHLICVDYEGRDICFTILHNLGGGRGLFRWIFSVLYQYYRELTGREPDLPGVRLPDQPPEPGEELTQPLASLPDIEPKWKGFPPEQRALPQSALEELLKEEKPEGVYMTMYTLDEKKVMARVKELGTSPSVWFSVVYYKALLRCLPKAPECLDLGVTSDVSDEYGFSESMSLITKFLLFRITAEDASLPMEELCAKGRAMLKEQRDPGATNELFKKERDTLIRMEELKTPEEKARYYLSHSMVTSTSPSTLVSYIGHYDMPGLKDFSEYFTIQGANTTNGLVIFAANDTFVAELAHKYPDPKLASAFEEELAAEGIEVISAERNMEQNNLGLELPG